MKATLKTMNKTVAAELTSNVIRDVKLNVTNQARLSNAYAFFFEWATMEKTIKDEMKARSNETMNDIEKKALRKKLRSGIGYDAWMKESKERRKFLKDNFTRLMCGSNNAMYFASDFGFNLIGSNLDKARYACLSMRGGNVNFNDWRYVLMNAIAGYLNKSVKKAIEDRVEYQVSQKAKRIK